MKVINYTTSYFAIFLLVIISLWAGAFYYLLLDEIYDSIDDGLDNQKGLIIQKAAIDTTVLRKQNFDEGDYSIKEIDPRLATSFHDIYVDTLMFMQNEQDFEPVRLLRTVFRQNNKYYQMQVITSMVEEDDLISELLYALLWLYLGLVAAILIINNVLLRRIWKPFYQLLRNLRNFRLGVDSDIAVPVTRIDEFRLLNEAVQKLLHSNINAFNSQKHLIENASHELQTPLAISINKLEALAERNTLKEEELSLLASALDNLERLTRLNKSLLLISKIENRQFTVDERVHIEVLVEKIAEDFSDQLKFSRISLKFDVVQPLVIKMNADLATILVTNLIKNSIVHNHPGGHINITIQETFLRIENSGKDGALDTGKIFLRFSKQESTASTGLGLSIVKSIADLYGLSIRYEYSNKHIFILEK